jgi:ATP-dependent Clp protease ATP-binding subunit ClpA
MRLSLAAVELSERYITNRFLDKAIDLMDEAASKSDD